MTDVTNGKAATAVKRWFGPRFATIHPLLQALHSTGGALSGTIRIEFGSGLAGWLGRRAARRLGIPTDRTQCGFVVEIRHEEDVLHWDRHFENGSSMTSCFRPVGTWPEGYWRESTGPLHFDLTVDVVEGGWYWRPLRVRFGRLALPIRLFANTEAYKRIEEGRYRFSVSFALPLIGTFLRYGGLLDLD